MQNDHLYQLSGEMKVPERNGRPLPYLELAWAFQDQDHTPQRETPDTTPNAGFARNRRLHAIPQTIGADERGPTR